MPVQQYNVHKTSGWWTKYIYVRIPYLQIINHPDWRHPEDRAWLVHLHPSHGVGQRGWPYRNLLDDQDPQLQPGRDMMSTERLHLLPITDHRNFKLKIKEWTDSYRKKEVMLLRTEMQPTWVLWIFPTLVQGNMLHEFGLPHTFLFSMLDQNANCTSPNQWEFLHSYLLNIRSK